jgi:EpsI family protein
MTAARSTGWWKPTYPADLAGWAAVAAGAGGLAFALARFWGANPGHADRLLVLLGAGYAAHSKALAGWGRVPSWPAAWAGLPLLLAGAVALPAGALLLGRAGPRALTLWWLAAAVLLLAAGFVLVRFGFARLRAAAFPLLFPLFALPVPDLVLSPLQTRLQEITTRLAVPALRAVGEDAVREGAGFVIALPGGRLGVEEACSGVRSLTALTAIAAFVAFLKGYGPVRGVGLVLLAVPLVVAVNALRVVASGLIQEHIGQQYVVGHWHEGLGFATVLVGLVLILLTAEGMGKAAPADPPADPVPPPRPGAAGVLAAGLLVLGAVAAVAAGGRAVAAVAATGQTAALDTLSPELGGWKAADKAIPPEVTEMLGPDRVSYRVFTSKLGQEAHVWVLYWASGSAIKGLHQPDICWGGRGFKPSDKWDEPLALAGGPLAVHAREFRQDRVRQTVLYWTQEGDRFLPDAEERERAIAPLSAAGWRWVGEYLGTAEAVPGGRLTVVVALPAAGPQARRDAADLTRRLADDLYRVCPWAALPAAGP